MVVGVGNVGKGYFVNLLFASEPIYFLVGRFLSFPPFVSVTSKIRMYVQFQILETLFLCTPGSSDRNCICSTYYLRTLL